MFYLTITSEAKARLNLLQVKSGSLDVESVFHKALATYDLFLNQEEGTEIVLRSKEGKERVVVLPDPDA